MAGDCRYGDQCKNGHPQVTQCVHPRAPCDPEPNEATPKRESVVIQQKHELEGTCHSTIMKALQAIQENQGELASRMDRMEGTQKNKISKGKHGEKIDIRELSNPENHTSKTQQEQARTEKMERRHRQDHVCDKREENRSREYTTIRDSHNKMSQRERARSDSLTKDKNKRPNCRNFDRGHCRFGRHCWYAHHINTQTDVNHPNKTPRRVDMSERSQTVRHKSDSRQSTTRDRTGERHQDRSKRRQEGARPKENQPNRTREEVRK